MSTAPEKLSAWIAREGRKKAWFADRIGATSAMVSRWLRCGVIPAARYREAIEKTTGGAVAASDWTRG